MATVTRVLGAISRDKLRFLFALGFTILFAATLWLRVSSLDAFPWHNGDESYYGFQTARMIQREAFANRTMNRNILNPYLVGLQIPFHFVSEPSIWVVRSPAVLSGILAIVLTYVLTAREFDRTTALFATVILATLPSSIYNSRVGLEMSQLPLCGVIVIAFAIRGQGVGLLLSFLASLIVHPTEIFVLPVAMSVFLVQLYRKGAGDLVSQRRMLIVSTVAGVVVVAAFSILMFQHPVAKIFLRRRPALDWTQFLDGYERLLFFLYEPIATKILRLHRWIFRGLSLFVLTFGTWRLVRERQWERVALIAGLASSLSGLHIIAGPRILRDYGTYRYGIVFLLPTALAFALLLRAVLMPRACEEATRQTPGRVPLAVALVLGSALLLTSKLNVFDPVTARIGESLWTFRSDGEDEYEQILALIQRDVAQRTRDQNLDANASARGPTLTPIVVENFWGFMPLAYLTSSSKDLEVIRVISEDELRQNPRSIISREKPRELCDRLRAGAYLVEMIPVPPGGEVENTIASAALTSFPSDCFQRWEVRNREGFPSFTVYRLKDAPAPPAVTRAAPEVGVRTIRR